MLKKQSAKKRTVVVFGTFDILHPGHQDLFRQARFYGNKIIAVLAKDKTVLRVKGRKPLRNEKERKENLKQKEWADRVVIGYARDKYRVIRELRPEVICLGYDQHYFTADLRNKLNKMRLNTKIVRLRPHQAHIHKSSKLRRKLYA